MTGVFQSDGPVLVVAPHPDDEILGAGGTMAKLADAGREVHVCIVTRGKPPAFSEKMIATTRDEAARAHAHIGVSHVHWMDHTAADLDSLPHKDLNASLGALIKEVDPSVLILPHVGDIHLDHQLIFLSGLVGARPHQAEFPHTVLAYETLSETNWNAPYLSPAFLPNVYCDISDTIDRKLDAFALFESQARQPPHERSVESLRALATLRGATVHAHAAEGFVLIRHVA